MAVRLPGCFSARIPAYLTMPSVFRPDPADRPDPIEWSPILHRARRGPLVARERELAAAMAELRRAAAGEARVLLISGEPGVGKTRLGQELVGRMQSAGGTALLAGCYPEGDMPYAPVARLIHDSFAQSAGPDLPQPVLADLIALVPALRSQYTDIPPNRSLDPRSEQQRLFESVVAWCEAATARAPLLLFVDDVHWADAATLFLLRHLARRGRRLRLLLVMAFREPEAEQVPNLGNMLLEFNRERLSTRLRLGRLDRAGTAALLASLLPPEAISPELLDGIYEQTDGNPFFVEEVCRALGEEGQPAGGDGRGPRPDGVEIRIPQTVREAVLARVARTSEHAQEALRLAAMVGREFDFETLRRAGDLEDETLIGALESAVAAQLITEAAAGSAAGARFSFAHPLIPAALRESTIHVRRQRLHGRIARVIEELRPDDYEALAYHYGQAGDAGRAQQYLLMAGDRAQAWAPEDAARLYRAALKQWPAADQRGQAETLAKLGHCLWAAADLAGAMQCYEAAYRLFDALGERLQSGEMQRLIGLMCVLQADRKMALHYFHRALDILQQGPETVELARAISSISQMYMSGDEPDEAVAWGERALGMAERLGARDVIQHALNNIGSGLWRKGDYEKGLSLMRESLDLALALGAPAEVSRAYLNLTFMLYAGCRYAEAAELAERMYAHAAGAFARAFINVAFYRLAKVSWLMGRWGAALDYRRRMPEPGGLHLAWTRIIFAHMDLDLGRVQEARRELLASLPRAERAADVQTTVTHAGEMLRVYAAAGQAAQADDAAEQILASVSPLRYPSIHAIMPVFYACRWLAAQRTPVRSEQAREAVSYLERLHGHLPTAETRAILAEARACLLAAERCPREAAAQLGQAAAAWETIGRPYEQARALASLAALRAAMGEPAGAAKARDQARAILESLAAQLAPELRAAFNASPLMLDLGRAGAEERKPAAMGHELAGLTDREIEVLKLVAQGLTNAQIAEVLVVSLPTVNGHVRSIFNKLDVSRRTAAARFAIEHGLA